MSSKELQLDDKTDCELVGLATRILKERRE